MNFLKTSFYSAIGSGISILSKLITQKIIAVYLGTHGMFLLGQLKDFIGISQTVSNLGMSNGIVKYTAEFKEEPSIVSKFISTGFRIHVGFSVAVFLFTWLFQETLAHYLFEDSGYAKYLVLLSFSMISVSVHTLFMSILNGLKRIKLYIAIQSISTIVSAIVLVTLVLLQQIEGAFTAFAIGQILSFGISTGTILLYKPFPLRLLLKPFNRNALLQLSQFSIMAFVAPVCMIGATFFIRNHLETKFDTNYAGSWEGLWRISAMYLLFFTMTFKLYLLPTFSSLNGAALRKEVFKIWKWVWPIVTLVTAAVYFLKDLVITVFLSEHFLLISGIMIFQLLGDIFKINCWVLGNILIAKAKTKFFIFLQIEWALVFCGLAVWLINLYGFKGVAMAYLGAYIIHFIILNLYFRKLLWTPES